MNSAMYPGEAPERQSHGGASGDAASRWMAILIGVVVTVAVLAVFAGIGAVLVWAGVTDGTGSRHVLAAVAVIGMLGSVASGSWAGSKATRPPGSLAVGALVALLTMVIAVVVVRPFVAPSADFRSVAIALDWIDAPDVGTGSSEALHRLVEAQAGDGDVDESDVRDTAMMKAIEAGIVLGVLGFALLLAGVLGAALNRGRASSAGPSVLSGERAFAPLGILMAGVAIVTYLGWSSLWAMTNAVVDFDQSTGPEVGVVFSEVATHPEPMWGKTVTVSSTVSRVIDPHAALLGNDAPMVGSQLLILSEPALQEQVLLASASGAELSEGDVVQVTGTVRRFDREELASDLGITLDDAAVSGYQGAGVMVVESIDLDVPVAAEAGDKEFGGGSSGYDYGVTIDDIVNTSDEYVGMTVTVSDEVEEGVLTPHSFTLGDPHLLVIRATAEEAVFVEATAYVTGEVGIFNVEEVEKRTGIDLDDASFSDFEGRPYILAESVTLAT